LRATPQNPIISRKIVGIHGTAGQNAYRGKRDMANGKLPSRVPWPDDVKKKGELTIGFGDSIGKAVWDRVFKDAIFEFNKLSNTHKLGVTFAAATDPAKANVEARAASGDFDFAYPPDIPKQTIRFDGKGTHGLCKPLLNEFTGPSRVPEYRMAKAIIYVPANPMGPDGGTLRAVGGPIKLVIAVHELIHACGLVSNDEHSVDDVFCWPQLRMGATATDDRLGTLGEEYTFGNPPRTGHRTVEMPPVFLKNETIQKIQKLWT
jgi:hypothetical protein